MNSIPYLIFFLFLFLSQFSIKEISGIKKNINTYFSFIFFLFVVFLFIGLRGFVENDWMGYYPMYTKLPVSFSAFLKDYYSSESYLYKDIGFSLFAFICKTICPNYFFFQFISFLIDFIILYYAFESLKSENIILNFLFFFLFSGIQIEIDLLRNSKSIALFMLSLQFSYGEKKSFIKYELLNLLGVLFHTSALIYLPLFFFLNKKHSRKFYILILTILIFIFFARIKILTSFLNSIISFLPNGRSLQKILNYLTDEHYSSVLFFSPIVLERIFTYCVFIYYLPRLERKESNVVFMNIHTCFMIVCLGCWDFYIVVMRVMLLFIVSYSVLYPEIYTLLTKKEKKAVFLFLLFIFCSYKTFTEYNSKVWKYTSALFESSYKENRQQQLRLIRKQ